MGNGVTIENEVNSLNSEMLPMMLPDLNCNFLLPSLVPYGVFRMCYLS